MCVSWIWTCITPMTRPHSSFGTKYLSPLGSFSFWISGKDVASITNFISLCCYFSTFLVSSFKYRSPPVSCSEGVQPAAKIRNYTQLVNSCVYNCEMPLLNLQRVSWISSQVIFVKFLLILKLGFRSFERCWTFWLAKCSWGEGYNS